MYLEPQSPGLAGIWRTVQCTWSHNHLAWLASGAQPNVPGATITWLGWRLAHSPMYLEPQSPGFAGVWTTVQCTWSHNHLAWLASCAQSNVPGATITWLGWRLVHSPMYLEPQSPGFAGVWTTVQCTWSHNHLAWLASGVQSNVPGATITWLCWRMDHSLVSNHMIPIVPHLSTRCYSHFRISTLHTCRYHTSFKMVYRLKRDDLSAHTCTRKHMHTHVHAYMRTRLKKS